MSYFRTCPFCGSNLDPCERCDCQERQEFNRIARRSNVPQLMKARTGGRVSAQAIRAAENRKAETA